LSGKDLKKSFFQKVYILNAAKENSFWNAISTKYQKIKYESQDEINKNSPSLVSSQHKYVGERL
jgi:hypothetical protein